MSSKWDEFEVSEVPMQADSGLRKKLIEVTYDMMREIGAENIRVRELSKRVGCSVAALYSHFDGMEQLLAFASVRFLRPYIKELEENLKKSDDIIVGEINAWKIFNKYAFSEPFMYINLFWGSMRNSLELVLQDYFELYPVFVEGPNMAMFYSSIFSGSIEERDEIWFRRMAAEGRIRHADVKSVSETNCLIARGLLMDYSNTDKDPEVYEEAVRHCNYLIERNIHAYLIR